LQRKMELEERIARLESRLSAYERLQVAAQQEWIQGREVPDRERNRERLRRRTVWNRSQRAVPRKGAIAVVGTGTLRMVLTRRPAHPPKTEVAQHCRLPIGVVCGCSAA